MWNIWAFLAKNWNVWSPNLETLHEENSGVLRKQLENEKKLAAKINKNKQRQRQKDTKTKRPKTEKTGKTERGGGAGQGGGGRSS